MTLLFLDLLNYLLLELLRPITDYTVKIGDIDFFMDLSYTGCNYKKSMFLLYIVSVYRSGS